MLWDQLNQDKNEIVVCNHDLLLSNSWSIFFHNAARYYVEPIHLVSRIIDYARKLLPVLGTTWD